MLGMFAADVLDAEVINHKGEENGARFMAEEAGGVFTLVVAVFGKVGNEGVVGDAAGLGEAIHAFVDFDVNVTFVDEGFKIVEFKNCLRDERDRDHHELGTGHRGVQVKVLDVHDHEACSWGGDNTVEEELGCGESSGFGADVSGVVNEIAANSPANSTGLSFLGAVCNDVAEVGCFATFGDLVEPDELDSVGSLGLLVPIGESTGFFSARFLPKVAFRTSEEFGVFDVVTGVRMDGFVGGAGRRVDNF